MTFICKMLSNLKFNFCALVLIYLVSYGAGAENVSRPALQDHPGHTIKHFGEYVEFDGTYIVLAGGSMQYFRIPRVHWEHRLGMLKSSGMNTLFMSIEWSTHEPMPSCFKFTGDEDFIYFIRIAQRLGLMVIVRPGPFIGEERDFGGFPPWLLWQIPGAELRLTDPDFKTRVVLYMQELLPRLKPLLAQQGGPVIEIEVTTEMGECEWLMQLMDKHLGFWNIYQTSTEERSGLPTVYETPGGWHTRPLVWYTNSWSSIWTERYKNDKLGYSRIVQDLQEALRNGLSIEIGAFHAGTDFGFKAGVAERGGGYALYETEYVDAPLAEDGSPRPIYAQIQSTVFSYFGMDRSNPLHHPALKMSLGNMTLWPAGSLLTRDNINSLSSVKKTQRDPATFEDLQQGYGFVLYETTIKKNISDAIIDLPSLRDRAQVYVDRKLKGVAFKGDADDMKVRLGDLVQGSLLQIFVENQGRLYWSPNQRNIRNHKGLGSVHIGFEEITSWTMYGFPLTYTTAIHRLVTSQAAGLIQDNVTVGTPMLAGVDFEIDKDPQELEDTFLDMRGWGRGVAFLNGRNLGRYWPDGGARKGLYVPKSFLRPRAEINHLAILELEQLPEVKRVVFTDDLEGSKSDLEGSNPSKGSKTAMSAPMFSVLAGLGFMLVVLSAVWCFRKETMQLMKKDGGKGVYIPLTSEDL